MSEKFRDSEGKQTDISEINKILVSGNIDSARDITQTSATVNVHGPVYAGSMNINVSSGGNLDEPSSCRADDAIVRDLSRRLKEWYSDLQLPLVTWMNEDDFPLDEYYVPLQLNSVRRATRNEDAANAGLRETNEIGGLSNVCRSLNLLNLPSVIDYSTRAINFVEIFDAVDGVSPKRILIEAQPGFGKTTLAHKIILDWRTGENYANRFDFALLIPLRYLRERTLRDVVFEILNEKDSEKVWNLISSDRTLLVLDGLDEVGDSERENILKMLYDKTGCNMTIVVTCRTGLFKLNESERDSMFTGVAKRYDFWDKKFEILGFHDESKKRFLKNFFTRERYDKFVQKFREVIDLDMLRSPLILILLVFISEDVETFTIETKTELYKKLVDCIIKRSVSKDVKVKLSENFTIFGNENSGDEYRANFCKFGQMSIDHILHNNLQFECNDFTDLIYRMGFLIKHETMKNKLNVLRQYEGCHLTFLEFAAAFSLWDQFKKNGNEFPTEAIDQINCICLRNSSVSMVLPFLCGLMGDDVKKLFDQLLDFHILYSLKENLISFVLCECVVSDDVCEIIAQFMPKTIYSAVYPKNGNLSKYIVSMEGECTDLWLLAEDGTVQIESICVSLLASFLYEDLCVKRCFKNQVSCENLFIDVRGEIKSYQEIAEQLDLVLNGVESNYKYLYIRQFNHQDSSYALMNDCVNNGILKHKTIEYLFCELPQFEIAADTVINIIKNNTVKKLELYLASYFDFDNVYKIIPVVASSPDVLSLQLINLIRLNYCVLGCKGSPPLSASEQVEVKRRSLDYRKRQMPLIDVSNFLNGGKYWRHVGLKFASTKCSVSLPNSVCIDSFQIFSYFTADSDVEILCALKPRNLQCDDKLFDRLMLMQNLHMWDGLKSVTNLILDIWKENGIQETLSHVNKFTNLKKITLRLTEILGPEEQRELVKCLPLFTVDQLQFRCEGLSSAVDIVSGVNDLIERKELKSIRSIDFEFLPTGYFDITKYFDFFSTIKVVLLNDFNVTVHFIDVHCWNLPLVIVIFESSKFNKQFFPRMSPSVWRYFRFECCWPYEDVLKIQKKLCCD